jgi:hypothetical protein
MQFRSCQICDARRFIRTKSEIKPSITSLEKEVSCQRNAIKGAPRKTPTSPKLLARHGASDIQQRKKSINLGRRSASLHRSIRSGGNQGLGQFFHLAQSDELFRDAECALRGSETAGQVSRSFAEETVREIVEATLGSVSQLVFDLNAVTISKGENPKIRTVIILSTRMSQAIHHAVNTNVKHMLLVVWISRG